MKIYLYANENKSMDVLISQIVIEVIKFKMITAIFEMDNF